MLTHQRKALILSRLQRDGRVIAKDFAAELDLSEDTVRRDMRDMAAVGLLARVHGGALPLSPDLPDFSTRKSRAGKEKQALATRAVALVQPGQMIFLDGGTTNAEIARLLPQNLGLTVITHSPTIAVELERRSDIEVILIGGRLYRHSMVAVGAVAAEAIARLRPHLFFLGATSVHPQHGVTTGDAEEAAIKRLIASVSAETYLCLTSEKLDTLSPCQILPLPALAGLIVGPSVEAARLTPYQVTGIALFQA
ncbi:DeoR family transcriptional regulator [Agrobacterium vitis]|uniref:DeoR/GlpR family DNA-binding transcription regulator n=1 Tax=Agrobacterium vitis TaxID=373 RepID=UPI0015D90508|nr:DeoR/GlpR family DNA-binding transcription regulator [Agrobacterium vitis]BCH60382.1 DeoR family transcriptional regulator [Agrobacterium vitis]